jgi:hypothetical protein
MTAPHPPEAEDLTGLARGKLQRVLGNVQGERAFNEALISTGLQIVASADDLYTLGEDLARRPGLEAAVGRLLCVAAVVRGTSRGR